MVDPSAHNASKVAAAYAQQHATDVPPVCVWGVWGGGGWVYA